jgi:hypothetical protein
MKSINIKKPPFGLKEHASVDVGKVAGVFVLVSF